MREKSGRTIKTSNFLKFQIMREFHKIHINRGRERTVQPLKGCVSSRGATYEEKVLTS